MANKMLIDATHPEETRVVVVRGNRVEEFDYESASRKQLRGNIYLAKVTRVEPSLQAAFIEYGGNRHGFLAFSEIHPDYYQIPVADRLALIEEEERAARLAEDEADMREKRRERGRSKKARADASVSEEAEEPVAAEVEPQSAEGADAAPEAAAPEAEAAAVEAAVGEAAPAAVEPAEITAPEEAPSDEVTEPAEAPVDVPAAEDHPIRHVDTVSELLIPAEAVAASEELVEAAADAVLGSALPAPVEQELDDARARRQEAEAGESHPAPILPEDDEAGDEVSAEAPAEARRAEEDDEDEDDGDIHQIDEDEEIEHLGADEDALEEVPERAPQRRARTYKIQEVIRRRQVMLVQVVKEERGNKGAALTTYLSLAGRYSVLMPNTARGGGISRKITNTTDRKRLKEVVQDLEVPEGMGVILRTAGANRTKTEIKRDFEYLLRLWETVRELTLSSAAPSLVYEEGSLIKRAIRDLYNKDIDDIQVAGEEGYKEAKDFMRMLMPSHAKAVLPYREPQPIFARFGVEQQLDAMFSPVVQLKSGGYIVIDPTEALVSIDVNSGRATREHHIEDTALKTNLEAAEEIARQLRLRDLAGLIVVDFIDMEEKRNNRAVERKLKDCLKNDRARIQIGRISHFGLLEMSRQRIRTGVLESSIEVCPHCGGTGHVRSAASVALQLLRALEEQLLRSVTHNLVARTRTEVALYVLNQKRAHLRDLEERFNVTLSVAADDTVTGHQPFIIDKGDLAAPPPPPPRAAPVVHPDSIAPEEAFLDEEEDDLEEASAETDAQGEDAGDKGDENGRRRRRRRRRRRPDEREESREDAAEGEDEDEAAAAADDSEGEDDAQSDEERGDDDAADRRRRRRGRRGGRRNRRERDGEGDETASDDTADDAATGDMASEDTASQDTVTGAETEDKSPATEPVAGADDATAAAPAAVTEAPAEGAASVSAPEPVAEAVEEPAARPARRRRSTVREKAPPVAAGAPVEPVAEPAAKPEAEPAEAPLEPASAETREAETPEAAPSESTPSEPPPAEASAEPAPTDPDTPPAKPRSGWWQRKLFGG
ncbi:MULTISPECIES: Rne/Rng family ribonuclease [unclassified Xanthobacter]|uniref:Rne/Rng family ribonuclease n=1 Tax=unclassified Xanthobacter TaxID=2623496 RepID=UPI001EDF7BD4|nr:MULTISPECIES: ribonuclease E/G [unclassified Xanthobacter]